MITNKETEIIKDVQIINGLNTNHQDQLIKPVSFNVINTIVNNPTKPIPELDDLSII